MATITAPEPAKTSVFDIAEIHPIAACFHYAGGVRAHYLVKVKNNPHKGFPWLVAVEQPDGTLKIDSCWFQQRKHAYGEFKAADKDIAYYIHNLDGKTFTQVSH